jgi:hypothetical protein
MIGIGLIAAPIVWLFLILAFFRLLVVARQLTITAYL